MSNYSEKMKTKFQFVNAGLYRTLMGLFIDGDKPGLIGFDYSRYEKKDIGYALDSLTKDVVWAYGDSAMEGLDMFLPGLDDERVDEVLKVAFREASRHETVALMEVLDPLVPEPEKQVALGVAVAAGKTPSAKWCLLHGASPNGKIPKQKGMEKEEDSSVKKEIGAMTKNGYTVTFPGRSPSETTSGWSFPLEKAVASGNMKMVDLLLSFGARSCFDGFSSVRILLEKLPTMQLPVGDHEGRKKEIWSRFYAGGVFSGADRYLPPGLLLKACLNDNPQAFDDFRNDGVSLGMLDMDEIIPVLKNVVSKGKWEILRRMANDVPDILNMPIVPVWAAKAGMGKTLGLVSSFPEVRSVLGASLELLEQTTASSEARAFLSSENERFMLETKKRGQASSVSRKSV